MPERVTPKSPTLEPSLVQATTEALLQLEEVHAFYDESHVLHGVNLQVDAGEVVALLGRNGAGKTTTLKAIMGLLDRRRGSICFDGSELIKLAANQVARLGIAYCPEERGIFSSLNVEENLLLPPVIKPGGMPLHEIYALFPNLRERRTSQGTRLSGGEQQMLAIGRILRTGSTLLLLDEPTEGLAPVIIRQIGDIVRKLRARGFTILLVEQNFHFATAVADRFYVMQEGRIVDMMVRENIEEEGGKLRAYLGV